MMIFLLPAIFVGIIGFRALEHLIAFAYPAYMSFKALRDREMETELAALHADELQTRRGRQKRDMKRGEIDLLQRDAETISELVHWLR